ncbi:uncharacterized protein LOC116201224 [Punica granatum]|uniref:Uncharacterized protein LOC116201224 n=2 Tax=Punica granatum TaxID=22663 RepID=A0A6P8CVZ1_PUNGR|nr:uncharacterized protein LOC116201224 [Punica granatum]
MAEAVHHLGQHDSLIIKPLKKTSPLLYRMILLVFAMICGIYIVSFCIKQISRSMIDDVQIIKMPFPQNATIESTVPLVHYPRPKTFNRSECAQNPVRFFAILSMQRSGSGWFEALLNSHMNLSSNGEIFSSLERRKNISSIIQTLDKVYNLDWFSSASKNECSAAVGFKWMFNQGLIQHHKEIAEYFNQRGVSAIFLFRRNLLRRMVSVLANSYDRFAKLLNGTHKSHVHSEEEASMLSTYKPVINSTSLINDLKEMEETVARALTYFNSTRHIVLYYEDIVQDKTKLKEVLEFLKVPVRELMTRQVKIHKGPLLDLISNWDEVHRSLNGTAYESFINNPDY